MAEIVGPRGAERVRLRLWRRSRLWRFVLSWQFLIPAVVLFIGWQLYPLLRVGWLSFTDYRALRPDEVSWVGLSNYAEAFRDSLVVQGLGRAALFTAMFLPGALVLPLITAVLIQKIRNNRIRTIYRTIILFPAMIPGPMIFLLWRWMYSPGIGPFNYLLVDVLGIFTVQNAPRWVGDPNLVFPSIITMEWWWGIGFHTVFFLAGLAAVSPELIDAARVDGAGEWKVFWHITLPALKPILLILVVIRLGSAMALIDEYLIFGGLNRSLPTYTWTVYMWDLAFRLGDRNYGYASAVGWIGSIAMLGVVVILFRVFRVRE